MSMKAYRHCKKLQRRARMLRRWIDWKEVDLRVHINSTQEKDYEI